MAALRAKLARAEEAREAAAASATASQAAAVAAQSEAEDEAGTEAGAGDASFAPVHLPKGEALGPGPSVWQVLKTEDGREYYHNTATNETTWTMPPDFDTELRASTVAV